MSKSGVRIITLVALAGVVVVGVLSVVGVRVSQHARRPPRTVARAPHVAEVAPLERPRVAPPQTEAPAAGQALLPTIASRARFTNHGTNAPELAPVPPPADGAQRKVVREEHPVPDGRRLILRRQLEAVLVRHPSVELAFVNCDDPECRVRAEARDLASLKSFLKEASGVATQMKVEIQEHTSAFNGTTYRADLEGPPPEATGG